MSTPTLAEALQFASDKQKVCMHLIWAAASAGLDRFDHEDFPELSERDWRAIDELAREAVDASLGLAIEDAAAAYGRLSERAAS